jgi:hypothetical protein
MDLLVSLLVKQGDHLFIHCHVVPDHLFGEVPDRLGVRPLQRVNGLLDVV